MTFIQPGDPEQLAKVVAAAQRWYEDTQRTMVVFWSPALNRYRWDYQARYEAKDNLEVVRIPK